MLTDLKMLHNSALAENPILRLLPHSAIFSCLFCFHPKKSSCYSKCLTSSKLNISQVIVLHVVRSCITIFTNPYILAKKIKFIPWCTQEKWNGKQLQLSCHKIKKANKKIQVQEFHLENLQYKKANENLWRMVLHPNAIDLPD